MALLDPQYLDAIKGSEGYNPNPAGAADYKQYSSGYGTKVQPGDENIPPDQRQAVYDQRFQDEIGKAGASVDAFSQNLPPGVRAALTSLTYNAGPGWQQSGLGEAVKAGDWDKARDIFLEYNHAGGKVDPGLTARRQREAAWFGAGLPAQSQPAPASPASPPGAPPNIQPQAAPIFAQAAPQAPQAQQAVPDQLPNFPAIQPVHIQYARPHQVSLAALRNALAQNQIFAR